MLSPEYNLERFHEDGFLEIPNFMSDDECQALRNRSLEIIEQADLSEVTSVFSTTHQTHTQDEYFHNSASSIKCFLELDALDSEGDLKQDAGSDISNGDTKLKVDLECAINKVGHAQHDLDPVFESFSYTPALAAIAKELGYVVPQLIQAMYIFKSPKTGGEVIAHTDHPFLWTEPQSVIGFWFAIDDATEENGCLWAMPGGHKSEPIRSRFKRTSNSETTTEILDDTPYDMEKFIPLPAKRGTLIMLDGRLPHKSDHNHSTKPRHAYTLHLIEGDSSRVTYLEDNWLQRSPEFPFRNLYEVVQTL